MPTECRFLIAVCDDTDTDRARVAGLADEIMSAAKVRHSITCFDSAEALLAAIQGGAQFSVLLLDVMMNEMNGMELARLLRQQQNKTDIIFISSNRDMAMYGYEVNAARYLAKPVDRDKLKDALLYCHRNWREKKEILLPTGKGQHRISFADIQFVEAFDRGTRFVLTRTALDTKLKFSEVEAMLPKSAFLVCHRAYIVNVTRVVCIRPYEFEMDSGEVVPIGKNRYYEINRKFIDRIAD